MKSGRLLKRIRLPTSRQPPLLFLIRHAEKPGNGLAGVTSHGTPDPKSLTTFGWRRAGALVQIFAPLPGRQSVETRLPLPTYVFAASPDAPGSNDPDRSKREKQTVHAIAESLNLKRDLRFGKGDEVKLARTVRKLAGPVLIAWEHERLSALARQFTADPVPEWPSNRFDMVWVLQPQRGGKYGFGQMPQLLLPGDSPEVFT